MPAGLPIAAGVPAARLHARPDDAHPQAIHLAVMLIIRVDKDGLPAIKLPIRAESAERVRVAAVVIERRRVGAVRYDLTRCAVRIERGLLLVEVIQAFAIFRGAFDT